jgi:hypothetical protein
LASPADWNLEKLIINENHYYSKGHYFNVGIAKINKFNDLSQDCEKNNCKLSQTLSAKEVLA